LKHTFSNNKSNHEAEILKGQRPSIDLVEAASETVISSLRKIRQDDNVWQELYQDITKLAEKQNVLPSKPRTAGRQQHRDNMPAGTPEEYW
jgi:hypothetical protein